MAYQYNIPWHMLKGLDPANSELCTLKGSVSTGLEPCARDEIAVKLKSVAFCARGRVFFDVKIEQVPEALKLRSLDHINVLIFVEPKFGFVSNKVLCLRRLRLLPRQLDWRKALGVWQNQSGFQGVPHTRRPDDQLEVIELTAEVPQPAGDGDGPAPSPDAACLLPVKVSGPEEQTVEDAGRARPEPEATQPAGSPTEEETGSAGGDAATAAQAAAAADAAGEAATGAVTDSAEPIRSSDVNSQEAADKEVGDTAPGERQNPTASIEPAQPKGVGGSAAEQVAPPATDPGGAEGLLSFRATCFRAGGGKKGHAFSSNEGAENFGGAVQDLFGWKVRMKGYDLEVVLDVEYDMVSVGLSLTPRALFYRNLVKMGPTSLRSTICYNLLMMAKPQPYEVVVDPMCGGGSISLEGAQAFPGSFHLCGDNYPDAAARVALNREYSSRQCSASAQLAVDVLTWDCTRLPLRDAVADVIVSDLPFGKRMGSKFDNRTLYPACMEEMARICTPRYGRAVLLTQDKRTMEKTLHSGRIKNLWRCRASPYVNIGGLDGCAYFLQRTDFVRRPPRPAPVSAGVAQSPPEVAAVPAAASADEAGVALSGEAAETTAAEERAVTAPDASV